MKRFVTLIGLVLVACGSEKVTDELPLTVIEQAMLGSYTLVSVSAGRVPIRIGKFLGDSGADVDVTGGAMVLTANHLHLRVNLKYTSRDPIQGTYIFTDSVVTDGSWNATNGSFTISRQDGPPISNPTVTGSVMLLTVVSSAFGRGAETQNLRLEK